MKFVLASNNIKKLKEMREILSELGLEVISQAEAGVNIEVEETGSTFEENAVLKATAVMEATGLPAVADDSGLMVDALGGEPGIYSARYGGEECKTDAERIEFLLRNMEDTDNRSASFVSMIACVFPDGRRIVTKGECTGLILKEPRGSGGFGYDPVFYLPEFGVTMAEMSAEEKNKISHRAKALNNLKEELKRIYTI
ncbi:MAG TPA: XTP/dITP diphosphatase [Clostridiales bacterium]|jgi:XTP/dITP diphosphohydrolase|nr:XTP/dITP diphosphatase [Clostridiales bacterium]